MTTTITDLRDYVDQVNNKIPYDVYSNLIDMIDTLDVVVKYDKIVEIIEKRRDDGTCMYDTIQEIEEVIEE